MGSWLSVLGCLFTGLVYVVGVDCEQKHLATQRYKRGCPSAKGCLNSFPSWCFFFVLGNSVRHHPLEAQQLVY